MRVLIATDAWAPQVNGVVRTLGELQKRAPAAGLVLDFVTPGDFRTLPMPGYPEIRLSMNVGPAFAARVGAFRPGAVHIATEGPIGLAARRHCLTHGIPFTTSYHTRFPEYLRARLPVPEAVTYRWLRWFHNAGCGIMTATPSLDADLAARGFGPLMRWSRGVDTALFQPGRQEALDLPRPIFLSVGRVAVEKNLDAFLSLDLPGSKVVVGDGPALESLKKAYPDAHFLGPKASAALADIYASSDVFVFPSRTDTFGLVIVEALASGLPVAAYPVMGPKDIITDPAVGCLGDDLRASALAALTLDRQACRAFAERYAWEVSVRQFAENMRNAVHSSQAPAFMRKRG